MVNKCELTINDKSFQVLDFRVQVGNAEDFGKPIVVSNVIKVFMQLGGHCDFLLEKYLHNPKTPFRCKIFVSEGGVSEIVKFDFDNCLISRYEYNFTPEFERKAFCTVEIFSEKVNYENDSRGMELPSRKPSR